MILKARPTSAPAAPAGTALPGPMTGLVARGLQARGRLSLLALHRTTPLETPYAAPTEAVALVQVDTYGTITLRNEANAPLVVPMHIGFFQKGAQNHATAQVRLLDALETRTFADCFCIQEAQGGLIREAPNRFLMLPHGLRHVALSLRGVDDYARLWNEIDAFTRRYGITRGGHFERFLRPNFRRLLPYRHAFEADSGQVGGAWYVDGALTGVEVCPNPTYFRDMLPILAIYGYGPSALLRDLRGDKQPTSRRLDLSRLRDLDDLTTRLAHDRASEEGWRRDALRDVANAPWTVTHERDHAGLKLTTLTHGPWLGQAVHEGADLVYLSLVRDEA